MTACAEKGFVCQAVLPSSAPPLCPHILSTEDRGAVCLRQAMKVAVYTYKGQVMPTPHHIFGPIFIYREQVTGRRQQSRMSLPLHMCDG